MEVPMNKRTKRAAWLLVLTLLAGMLCGGCSIGGSKIVITSGVGRRDVFKIGGDSCNVSEARVYLANYQNIYGKSYGIDLWEKGFQKKKLTEYVKDVAMSEMTRIVCMDLLAENQEITLTDAEEAVVESSAKTYYVSLTDAEKDYMGVSETDIAEMYHDYALAQKVYGALTSTVDEEVSDDEARIMEAMQIVVASEEKAKEVEQKLSGGEDFAAVASNYNEAGTIEITFGRGELPSQVEKAAFELEDGEVSPAIPTDSGYYFIKCTNKFNEELTDANKSNIVAAREKAAFDDVYDAFVSGLSSSLNEKIWNSIELVTDGSIKTDSFFQVIDEALGDI